MQAMFEAATKDPLVAFFATIVMLVVIVAIRSLIGSALKAIVVVFRGYPQPFPVQHDDDDYDDDEDTWKEHRVELPVEWVNLMGEIIGKKVLSDEFLDRLALKIADRQNELNADETSDDALVTRFVDAVRDQFNAVGLNAADIEAIAGRTLDLLAEREAKAAPVVAKDGEYKRDDLIEYHDRGEWKPGWYAGYYKSGSDDASPHHIAYIDWVDPDGDTGIEYDYVRDDQIRHRCPAPLATI